MNRKLKYPDSLFISITLFFLALPVHLRIDRGTETDVMATMHMYLCDKHDILDDPTESVLYGPSTQNKIERWWRELLERLEKFFKQQLRTLAEDGDYDPTSMIDR